MATAPNLADEMHEFVKKLFPICRSISGDGLRSTLDLISAHIPLKQIEVATGTQVFDWTIPDEWNIRDAYIKDDSGRRLVDFSESNLHVVNYSEPVAASLTWNELEPHLHSLPEAPDWIPYRTSYYHRTWGFCLPHRMKMKMAKRPDARYEVRIESSLQPGHLTYGELVIPGKSEQSVLISSHVCHPSLCNDNLSGISVATFLAKELCAKRDLHYTYRFLFAPGTIGAIAWLATNVDLISSIKHGLVLSLLGDEAPLAYKRSRQHDSVTNQIVEYLLKQRSPESQVYDFEPYGYDERQYCSPGVNLDVGSLSRSTYAQFPEYHTSADNLSFISGKRLEESLRFCLKVVETFERNVTYINQNPMCEPQLGRRGLYDMPCFREPSAQLQLALLWVLNLSDGTHSLFNISSRSGIPFDTIWEAAQAAAACKLLEPC